MRFLLSMLLLSFSVNAFANDCKFLFNFPSIKEDPAFKCDNMIQGNIKKLVITEKGTDLTINFYYQNQEVNLSVPSKITDKRWKINQTVYLDKNDGHLKLDTARPHID